MFFKISFKNSMVYRWKVLFSILGSIIFITINLSLWRYLYRDRPEMIIYMTKYTIISSIISMFYAQGIADKIGDKVQTGAFVTDLIRPVNFFTMSWQLELADICSNFFIRGIPIILVYWPLLVVNTEYYNLPVVLFSVFLGHLLFLLIYSLLGFGAFILIEIWPFKRFLDDTIRLLAGSFIPLGLLPPVLRSITDVLPFRFLYAFPLELLLGRVDMHTAIEDISLLIMWIIIFALLNVFMYRLALKKAVVQGG